MDVIDAKWIRDRLSGRRGEQAKLAAALGINGDKMSKTLRGERRVQPEEIPKVLEFFGEREDSRVSNTTIGEDGLPPMVVIKPLADLNGYGCTIDRTPGNLGLPSDYLAQMTNSRAEALAMYRVEGDGMKPTLNDHDIILLDSSNTNLSFDGLFVLSFGDSLMVKRVGRSPKAGHITVLSDNRDVYPPMEAPIESIKAVGKILWYGRQV